MIEATTPAGSARPETARHRSLTLRPVAERTMVGLARLLIRTFFRQVQVEHGARLHSDRPTVLVANHRNGLVDGLLLMAALGRYPRFLGKSTLFHNPLLWPFLKLGGVVPIYRAADGATMTRNTATFSVSNRLLARGGMVAIFPEGISHDEPALQPLRTGAARIALGAATSGVPDVETVAVALVYDEKQTFRSRALVRVGDPQPTDRWRAAGAGAGSDDRQAVRLLTEDLAARLRAVGPDYASWAEAEMLGDIADIVARPCTDLPADVGLADREHIMEALTAAGTSEEWQRATDTLHGAYRAYRSDLDMIGLSDAQVAADYGSGRLGWRFLWAAAKVAGALPFAIVGMMIHVIPYTMVKMASRVPNNNGIRATVKLLGSFFIYTAVYTAPGVVAGATFGALVGLLVAAGAPACGYVAVRLMERLRRMGAARQGYRSGRVGGPMLESVLARRTAVVDAARAVLAVGGPTPRGP